MSAILKTKGKLKIMRENPVHEYAPHTISLLHGALVA